MKKTLWAFLFLSRLLFAELNTFEGLTPVGPRVPLQVEWEVKDGIDTPESAYWDKETGFLYISNIAGAGNGKDGKGWISKYKADGKVVTKEWVKGLDAPKGMRSYKGSLWVSDIDRVHEISLKEGKIKNTLSIPGSVFLNDVAVDQEGSVYVSDMIGTKIYKIQDGKHSVFAEGPDLESPNGLLVDEGNLLVAAWGLSKADFSTKIPGRLYSLDLKTKARKNIVPAPFANLDGLEKAKAGFWVSDWVAGKLFLIDAKGESTLLIDGLKGPGDLAYISEKQLLIVPRMGENTVTAYNTSKLKL